MYCAKHGNHKKRGSCMLIGILLPHSPKYIVLVIGCPLNIIDLNLIGKIKSRHAQFNSAHTYTDAFIWTHLRTYNPHIHI